MIFQFKNNQDIPDPVPVKLADMGSVLSQFREDFMSAISIPDQDFPANKEVSIDIEVEVVLVPKACTLHITKK